MLCGCVVIQLVVMAVFFFSSRRRHTRCSRDWSSDVCSSDLRAMDRRDMDVVREEFVRAAQMAEAAGFDILEIHFAHGYLLARDRKSTRLNSSHGYISYAVFCLKKKKKNKITEHPPLLQQTIRPDRDITT